MTDIQVIYQTRSMSLAAKNRMKMLAAQMGKSLEEVLNQVIVIGVPILEEKINGKKQ